PVIVMLKKRQKRLEAVPAVPHQTCFNRVSQSDPSGIGVDLDGASLSGLRQKFNVWKRSPNQNQGIALFDRFLRRSGPQKANPARGVNAIIRNSRLPEKRLD